MPIVKNIFHIVHFVYETAPEELQINNIAQKLYLKREKLIAIRDMTHIFLCEEHQNDVYFSINDALHNQIQQIHLPNTYISDRQILHRHRLR